MAGLPLLPGKITLDKISLMPTRKLKCNNAHEKGSNAILLEGDLELGFFLGTDLEKESWCGTHWIRAFALKQMQWD